VLKWRREEAFVCFWWGNLEDSQTKKQKRDRMVTLRFSQKMCSGCQEEQTVDHDQQQVVVSVVLNVSVYQGVM